MLLLTIPAALASGALFGVDAPPPSDGGRMVIGTYADRTVLTVAPHVGPTEGRFAWVLPLPAAPAAWDVGVGEADWIDDIDRFTTPTLRAWTCDDFGDVDTGGYGPYGYPGYYDEDTGLRVYEGPFRDHPGRGPLYCEGGGQGCGTRYYGPYGTWVQPDLSDRAGAVVERIPPPSRGQAAWTLEIVAADSVEPVAGRLAQLGLAVSDDARGALGRHLGAEARFLVAWADGTDGGELPPVHITLPHPFDQLPLQVAAPEGPASREWTVLLVQPGGGAALWPWPAVDVPDACMLDAADEAAFVAAYRDFLDAAFDGDGDTATASAPRWLREYQGPTNSCTNCDRTPRMEVIEALTGAPVDQQGSFGVTRLRLRYAPDALADDPAFVQAAGDVEETSYIRYLPSLEATFPTCDAGWTEAPQTCFDAPTARVSWPYGGGAAAMFVGFGWARRRRAALTATRPTKTSHRGSTPTPSA